MSKRRQSLVKVLREAQQLLRRPGNDFSWSSWNSSSEATEEIEGLIASIESGRLPDRVNITVLCAPTGPIQEVSLSSGWGEEFLELAQRMDTAVARAYGPPLAPQLRWKRFGLAGIAVLVATLLITRFVPNKGFDFPATREIASMNAKFIERDSGDERSFLVPTTSQDEILAALSPSTRDRFPSKWEIMGKLDIKTISGNSIYVMLFDLGDDSVGAFAAGPTFESRRYYRGGNSAQLRIALEKALSQSEPR
jgi:hypothetical protein